MKNMTDKQIKKALFRPDLTDGERKSLEIGLLVRREIKEGERK